MYIVKLGEVELKVRGTSLEVVGPDEQPAGNNEDQPDRKDQEIIFRFL